nr:MAG TPA: hypothetical protein [Caudoviricetes sp.]
MDETKLKKLFYEVKATTSDVIYAAFVFGMLYLLIHALITDAKGDDNRVKGSSITVTSKGHEYIIFETARGYTCCIHSASCPCEKNHLKR